MSEIEKQHETLLADYNIMAEKIRHATIDLYRTETIIPLAIAAFYSWLFGYSNCYNVSRVMLVIPVILTALGGFRQFLRYKYIDCAEDYLILVESKLYPGENPLGWVRHYRREFRAPHKLMRAIFWFVLLSLTTLLAVTGART